MKITIELYNPTPAEAEALAVLFRASPTERDRYEPSVGDCGPAAGAPVAVVPPPVEQDDILGGAPAPRAVPAPPAPVVPPPPVATDAPERDASGLPWDGRIHASSKALLSDGTWRQRRNTDPALVKAVTEELRAALAAPSAVEPAPGLAFGPVQHGSPAVVPPPPPPVESPAMDFPSFMRAITAARTAPAVVLDACKAVGMPSIPALAQRPDLIPTVAAALGVA